MTSRAEQQIAPPSWGSGQARRSGAPRLRSVPARAAVRWGIRGSARADVAGAVLVLGAAAALWAWALAALW